MDTNLNHEQSLTLINEMIAQARNNFQKGSGTGFIFHGYSVACTALLNIALVFLLPHPHQSFWVWWLMLPAWLIDRFIIDRKRDKEALVKTHIDKIIKAAWSGFGIAVVILLMAVFGYGIAQKSANIFILITPLIMIMVGISEFITGVACRFALLKRGAYVMWGGALACLAAYVCWPSWSFVSHMLIMALCMILAFVVPGYQMNKMAKVCFKS
jgi:hypothetical protein